MTFETISRILAHAGEVFDAADASSALPSGGPRESVAARRFVEAYTNLSFGWKAAAVLAGAGEPFPVLLKGRDKWVWRAYCHLSGWCDDPVVGVARALACGELGQQGHVIRALLLARDWGESRKRELFAGFPVGPECVDAFEQLFWNVGDRARDKFWLARVVYPAGRLEETMDGYVSETPFAVQLMRGGYNIGTDFVRFMAGIDTDWLSKVGASRDLPDRLERHLLTAAFFLANAGFVNQDRNVAAIRHARGLLQAAKQGGETSDQPPVSDSAAALLRSSFMLAGREAAAAADERGRRVREELRAAGHSVIDV